MKLLLSIDIYITKLIIITFITYMKQAKNKNHTKIDYLHQGKIHINKLADKNDKCI